MKASGDSRPAAGSSTTWRAGCGSAPSTSTRASRTATASSSARRARPPRRTRSSSPTRAAPTSGVPTSSSSRPSASPPPIVSDGDHRGGRGGRRESLLCVLCALRGGMPLPLDGLVLVEAVVEGLQADLQGLGGLLLVAAAAL